MYQFPFSQNPLLDHRRPRQPFDLQQLLIPQQQEQINPPEPNFMERYRQLIANQPTTDRLTELATQAPRREDYKASGMTRLAAILSAGAGGFAGMDGYGMAMEALDKPYNRAYDDYEKKVRGLSGVASLEQDKIRQEIQALGFERDNYYRTQDDKRANEGLGLQKKQLELSQKNTEEDNRRASEEAEARNWETFENKSTGETFQRHRVTGAIRAIGKLDESLEEKNKRLKEQKKYETDQSIRQGVTVDAARTANDLKVVAAQGDNQLKRVQEAAKLKAEGVAKQLAAKAANMPEGDKRKKLFNDLAQAVAADPSLANEEYVQINSIGNPEVKPDSMFDNDEDLAAKKKLRMIISNSFSSGGNAPKADPLGIRR